MSVRKQSKLRERVKSDEKVYSTQIRLPMQMAIDVRNLAHNSGVSINSVMVQAIESMLYENKGDK